MARPECRHYRGDKPCKHKRACGGCTQFEATAERILVIKLGALGDLLRTTCLLPPLRAKYPNARITWITAPECAPLLQNLADIDEVWTTGTDLTARLLAREFDIAFNFDKEAPAPELLTLARAADKRGFLIGPHNTLDIANAASAYSLELGIDDELKFRKNTKTYPEIVHEMAELTIADPAPLPQLALTPKERKTARENLVHVAGGKLPDAPLLGLHPGASARFATKKWHWERYAAVCSRLHKEKGVVPVLFGGVAEEDLLLNLEAYFKRMGTPVIRASKPGTELPLRQFCATVAECDAILCGDTLALHVALALQVPTVTLLLSTCSSEIETYGIATMLVGKASCAPCYLAVCSQQTQICADSLSVDDVTAAVARRLKSAAARRKAG